VNDISPEIRLRELGGSMMSSPPSIDDPNYRTSQDAGAGKKKGTATDHDDVTTATLPIIPISQIPPTPWAYGRFLLFGGAAVIGAVDGGGKGAIAVAIMLSVIAGAPLLGEYVWKSGPVAVVTYEDDATERHRRIAAACIHYGTDYETVLANVRFICRAKGRITFSRHGEHGIEFPAVMAAVAIEDGACDMARILAAHLPIDVARNVVDQWVTLQRASWVGGPGLPESIAEGDGRPVPVGHACWFEHPLFDDLTPSARDWGEAAADAGATA
jgi:hypothetical protein